MRERGFEIAKGWENCGIILPQRQTAHSAGYDIMAAEETILPAYRENQAPTLVPTGLKAYCQPDECYFLFNRSSNPSKGYVLANAVGVIDSDYYNNPENDGHFRILLQNITDHEIKIKKGDRIAQLIFQKYLTVDDDLATGARSGGLGSTDRKILRIVYDLDDILWPCTETTFKKLGIDYQRQKNFRIYEDDSFTKEEQEKIIAAFADVDFFQHMPFYDGATKIFDLEDADTHVQINTNCYSEAILESKREQLMQLFPKIRPDQLRLNHVAAKGNHKKISADVLVFVDDNPYNMESSDAKFNFMPVKPWNKSRRMREIACAGGKIFVNDAHDKLPELVKSPDRFVISYYDLPEVQDLIRQTVQLTKDLKS